MYAIAGNRWKDFCMQLENGPVQAEQLGCEPERRQQLAAEGDPL